MNTKKPFPITDVNMTRFFLTLEDGVNFVIESFSKMIGGEIFIPKIFSIKITDLARCLDPNKPLDIIGLRPGEKIHEVMTSKDDNRSLIEFKNYYNLASSSVYKNLNKFLINKNREKGKFVNENFEFSSEKNKFLNDKEIKKMIKSDMNF
jgi:UDP-N-acetylglucosamine 4,6-dehydratase